MKYNISSISTMTRSWGRQNDGTTLTLKSFCSGAPPSRHDTTTERNATKTMVSRVGVSFCRDGVSFWRDGVSFWRDGVSLCRVGVSWRRDGVSWRRVGVSWRRDGVSCRRDGASWCRGRQHATVIWTPSDTILLCFCYSHWFTLNIESRLDNTTGQTAQQDQTRTRKHWGRRTIYYLSNEGESTNMNIEHTCTIKEQRQNISESSDFLKMTQANTYCVLKIC